MIDDGEGAARRGASASLEAAEWHARLAAARVSRDDTERFRLWLRHPENARAWRDIAQLWREAEELAEDPEIEALVRSAATGRPHPPRTRRRPVLAGIALLAALLTSGGAAWAFWPVTLEASRGEARQLRLADGSGVVLSDDGAVRLRRVGSPRRLSVLRGTVEISVHAAAPGPLRVDAGPVRIESPDGLLSIVREGQAVTIAVRDGHASVVDVVHGRVAPLAAGDSLRRTDEGLDIDSAQTATPAPATPVVFRDAPLSAVAETVSRLAPVDIDVIGPARERRISGVFSPHDPAGFLALLAALPGLTSDRLPDGRIRLREKSRDGP